MSKIIDYSLPVLMFLYPLAITLILLALFGKMFAHDRAVYVCVTIFTAFSALFDFMKTLPASIQNSLHLEFALAFAKKIFPFFDLNFGWVAPAAIGFILGMLIHVSRKNRVK